MKASDLISALKLQLALASQGGKDVCRHKINKLIIVVHGVRQRLFAHLLHVVEVVS